MLLKIFICLMGCKFKCLKYVKPLRGMSFENKDIKSEA